MKYRQILLATLTAVSLIATTTAEAAALPNIEAAEAADQACARILTNQQIHGTAFYKGANNPGELATVIERSLHDDQTGMTRVRPLKAGDQAYATPMQWFCAIKAVNSQATNLRTVADLPAYLRGLTEADTSGLGNRVILSACITVAGVRMSCQPRPYRRGEKVWIDAQTAVAVLMQDCSNVIKGPVVPQRCYIFRFDYSGEMDLRLIQGTGGDYAIVSHHMSLTDAQYRRMYADDCFFVQDEAGRRKPELGCPQLLCPPGSTWPTIALARDVGLPDERPNLTFSTGLLHGRGILSMPVWAAAALREYVPCVAVRPYRVSFRGYGNLAAFMRFDRAQGHQIRPTIPAGEYNVVFRGSGHY